MKRLVLVLLAAGGAFAADCPAMPPSHLPQPQTPLNIDLIKKQLRAYHDGDYVKDIATVYTAALSYIESRAGQVKKPAVVLDIDETSLTNWPNIDADDFGFIADGRCDTLPKGPCGFNAWVLMGTAKAIAPALDFFNAVKSKGVAVVFITGRRDNQRQATLWNLDHAGFEGWAKLITRPDRDEFKTVEEYKSKARAKLLTEEKYTIIASIGDQQSDIDQQSGVSAGKPECGFKLPNPFYFIE